MTDTVNSMVDEVMDHILNGNALCKAVVCQDGFIMSVQASSHHACLPKDDVGPYTHFEVFASTYCEQLIGYVDDAAAGVTGYFGVWVPAAVLEEITTAHGGKK